MNSVIKTFDCVDSKHGVAQKIYERVGTMSQQEQLAFWKKESTILKTKMKKK